MICNPGRLDDRINLPTGDAALLDAGQKESDQRIAECAISLLLVSLDLSQGVLPGAA
jgi:hypothetical protein